MSAEKISLIEWLGVITTPGKQEGNTIVAEAQPLPKEFLDEVQVMTHYVTKGEFIPTKEHMAQTMFMVIMKKYNECTEKEKRSIVRSDLEFMTMMYIHIARLFGFKDKDHYGFPQDELKAIYGDFYKEIPEESIPRIPRGKELLWSNFGDPEPERLSEEFNRKFKVIADAVWLALMKQYPVECSIAAGYKNEKINRRPMMINSANQEAKTMMEATGYQFVNLAIPSITKGLVEYVAEENKLDNDSKKRMEREVLKSVRRQSNKLLTEIEEATYND